MLAVYFEPLIVRADFLEAGFDQVASFEGHMRVLTAPDM